MKIHLANTASLLNGLYGILSIGFSIIGNLDLSIRALFFALCLDALDGTLARTFGSHRNGKWLDRHMDRISMCVAPAVLLAAYSNWNLIAVLGGLLLILAGLEGLRYTGGAEYFSGLPLSVASLLIIGTVMGNIAVPMWLFVFSALLVALRGIHYPRRLSVLRNGVRKPLPFARFMIGRTWMIRVSLLWLLAMMPVSFFGVAGLIIFWIALIYAVFAPFLYAYIYLKEITFTSHL